MSFEEIYAALKAPVMRYALRVLRVRESAEELTQEIFIKLFRFRGSYKSDHPFLGWFWTLARNATVDWLRLNASSASGADELVEDQLACKGPGMEAVLVHRSFRRELLGHLKVLTRLQRRVLWLRFVHELSYQEIARKLGTSLDAVKCAAYRAREVLKLENSALALMGASGMIGA